MSIGADFLSIFVLNIPRIFFNIAIFFRKFQSFAALYLNSHLNETNPYNDLEAM